MKLGEIMVKNRWATEEDVQKGLRFQQQNGGLFGEAMVKLEIINLEQLAKALGQQNRIPFASKANGILNPERGENLEKLISEKFARDNNVVPLFIEDGVLAVAVCDPSNMMLADNIRLISGMEPQLFVATKADIIKVIDEFYQGSANLLDTILDTSAEKEDAGGEDNSLENDGLTPDGKLDLDRLISGETKGAQSIKFVNAMLKQAIGERTSDIHLEKFDTRVSLRFRIDGLLYERSAPPDELFDPVISRIKILAKLDISERRLPQDGSFSIKYQNAVIENRVSICPTVFGEKMVLRILNKSDSTLTINAIGFEPKQKEDFLKAANAPNGLILLTGPTGSGKTTTLSAVLNTIKDPSLNIMTLEDPVEVKMEGISQVQIKPLIGLTFSAGLRSFLRQDPDIILVGEVRDNETAEACIKAAMTGHLVLSTLHTNSALEAIPRLLDMGIERYLLAGTLLLLAAQRLVRHLCPECKVPYKPSKMEIEQCMSECMLDPLPDPNRLVFYKPRGCPKCLNIGYKGRRAIFEIYFNSPAMKDVLYKDGDMAKIKAAAKKEGTWNLRASGWRKVMQGLTSVEEMLSVTVTDK